MPTVALFVTCLADQLFPDTAVATVRLLEAAGCSVEFPAAQSCCGQPAVNSGEPEAAVPLARRFVEVFEPYDAVVGPSGSCSGTVRHWYAQLLPGDLARRAERVAAKTFELSQYLVDELGVTDVGARVTNTVTFHDACHGLRHLGIRAQPRVLLEAAGAAVVEMPESETCCGFGGTFAVKHGEISGALADDKLRHAATTTAEFLVSTDGACLMHLAGRQRRTGVGPTPIHLADLLARGLP
ncbi:MAG: (Fe-S)-binding protein [Acidimicrobiia bacterium]